MSKVNRLKNKRGTQEACLSYFLRDWWGQRISVT